MIKNPYIVLGIHRGADKQAIKQAYRRAAKRSHPDLCSDNDGQRFEFLPESPMEQGRPSFWTKAGRPMPFSTC